MTITKTIMNVDLTTASVSNHWPADKSDFVLIDSVTKGEAREAIYQKVTDSDIDHPMTVRVGYYPKVQAGRPSANVSVKLSTFLSVDDGTEVTYEPFTVTLALSGPGNSGGLDAGGALAALTNVLSWLAPLTAGAFGNTAVALVKYGVVNTLHTLAD